MVIDRYDCLLIQLEFNELKQEACSLNCPIEKLHKQNITIKSINSMGWERLETLRTYYKNVRISYSKRF